MPTPKKVAAAPPVAPSPIPAIHSRGDLAGSPCHSDPPVAGLAPVSRVLSHISPASPHSASPAAVSSVSIVDDPTAAGPSTAPSAPDNPTTRPGALRDVPLAKVVEMAPVFDENMAAIAVPIAVCAGRSNPVVRIATATPAPPATNESGGRSESVTAASFRQRSRDLKDRGHRVRGSGTAP